MFAVMRIAGVAAVALSLATALGQETPAPQTSAAALTRHYTAGDVLHYEMKGSNQGWEYTIHATDTVKQDSAGTFFEELAWSDLHSNAPMTLSPASLAFRQTLSLDGNGKYLTVPNLQNLQPFLIGPITDTLTFYSDLFLAQSRHLSAGTPQVHFAHGTPNSWADGQHVLLGQDSIDFDLTLESVNAADGAATILVKHVPPTHPQIQLPADWMKTPVADTPNNWVQVSHEGNVFHAQVGKETFDVRLLIDAKDGKILSVHLDNPLTTISRDCQDAALLHCSDPKPETIRRVVSFQLLP